MAVPVAPVHAMTAVQRSGVQLPAPGCRKPHLTTALAVVSLPRCREFRQFLVVADERY